MTAEEQRILSRLARALRLNCSEAWSDLRHQTQHGPECAEFPYYPAAVEFQPAARDAIAGLCDSDKRVLLAEWRSMPRHPYTFTEDGRILIQYGLVLLDLIVRRARMAGRRTREL
jgi:hypothetical protein